MKKTKKEFVWYWVGGGYNWTFAESLEEAIEIADNYCSLTVMEGTVREAEKGEVERLDRLYAGMFN